MLVKCKTCGNKIEKGDSYCYLHKTKSGKIQKRYYCNREHFHKPYIDNVYYNRTRRLTDKILGYICISNNFQECQVFQILQYFFIKMILLVE